MAGAAEGGGEEPGGEGEEDDVEAGGGEEVAGGGGLACEHGAHSFEDVCGREAEGHRLEPCGKDAHRVEDGGDGLDEKRDGPAEGFGGLAKAEDE